MHEGTDFGAVDEQVEEFSRRWINLADMRLGAEAIFATDEFFGSKSRLLNPAPPIAIPEKYDAHGKWMDGWETRRRRGEGHDHCVIRLGVSGIIRAVDIDTSHFIGNYPPAASLESYYGEDAPQEDSRWTEIVPPTNLEGEMHHPIEVTTEQPSTLLRLNIFPDGGIARLRAFGEPYCDWGNRDQMALHELSAIANGGHVVAYNDAHFGNPFNILYPGRGIDMGDGWETRRRREPGNDWIIIALGHPGTIEGIEVDTAHFKGNYPDRCSIQAAYVRGTVELPLVAQSMFWPVLLSESKLEMDRQHYFKGNVIEQLGPISHARLNIFPDGGISRLRLIGRLVAE